MNATLIDIQRAGTHDGPGIRTVFFFKGCPLRCKWCHNPESWQREPQLSFHQEACTLCGRCTAVCPAQAHVLTDLQHFPLAKISPAHAVTAGQSAAPDTSGIPGAAGTLAGHAVYFNRCVRCGRCVDVCPSRALKLIGTSYTPEELLEIARRDLPFYEQTGGGVTLSGGEILLWADFAAAFLSLCKKDSIHTCVETSGFGTADAMKKLMPHTDLFYFDWKVSSEEKARKYLNGSLAPIQKNLGLLCRAQKNVVLRCPIILGINDDDEHFGAILGLLAELPAIQKAHLLPYHDFGVGKSRNIGSGMDSFPVPKQADIDRWQNWFSLHAAKQRNKIEIDWQAGLFRS